jgi:hypothetical protein
MIDDSRMNDYAEAVFMASPAAKADPVWAARVWAEAVAADEAEAAEATA